MAVRFGDLSEKLRDNVETDIEIIHLQNPKSKNLDKKIIKYFEIMERKNEVLYKQVLGLMIADTYKLLNIKRIDALASKEELEMLDYYENFNNNTAVSFLKVNPIELISALYFMSEFNSYDYFMKRSILVDSKDKAKYLCKLSEFSIYDFLYYCQKYEPETLRFIYDSDIKEGYSEEMVLEKLVNKVNELYVFDKENYNELIIDLLTKYYLIGKNNLIKENHYDFVPYMECHDTAEILNYLNDDDIMADILKAYINFEGDYSSLKINTDNQTIQKIKSIKEF